MERTIYRLVILALLAGAAVASDDGTIPPRQSIVTEKPNIIDPSGGAMLPTDGCQAQVIINPAPLPIGADQVINSGLTVDLRGLNICSPPPEGGDPLQRSILRSQFYPSP